MFEIKKSNSTELVSPEIINEGAFLWVWQPENTPPHLGFSFGGKYFSIQFEKRQFELPVLNLFEIVERKKTSLIWLEIIGNDLKTNEVFAKYESCSANNCSCIQPILDLFEIRNKEAILFDLLQILDSLKMLGKLYHKNLPENFYHIKHYSREEVDNHLISLKV